MSKNQAPTFRIPFINQAVEVEETMFPAVPPKWRVELDKAMAAMEGAVELGTALVHINKSLDLAESFMKEEETDTEMEVDKPKPLPKKPTARILSVYKRRPVGKIQKPKAPRKPRKGAMKYKGRPVSPMKLTGKTCQPNETYRQFE